MEQAKFEAMTMQSDSYYNQLVVNTDKLNQYGKENEKLKRNSKFKNYLIAGLAVIVTGMVIK